MATIVEVARAAGVSLGTASRVMNRHPAVGAENVAKVLRAAEELGYVHRRTRTGLTLRTGNVGVVLLGMDRSLVSLPVIAEAIHGVQAALSAAGATALMADLPGLDRLPPFLQQDKVDGVIVKGPLQGRLPEPGRNALCDRLRALPCVWLLGRPRGAWGDHAGSDNGRVGLLAAEHLKDRGHETVAYLNPRTGHTTFEERRAAFEFHARALGLDVQVFEPRRREPERFPIDAEGTLPGVADLLEKLLRARKRPTAVFVPADRFAVLLYRACAERGVRIGPDLAVLSCNRERSLTESLNPTLASIDIHANEIGARAVDLLLWRLQHREATETEVLLRPRLLEGASL